MNKIKKIFATILIVALTFTGCSIKQKPTTIFSNKQFFYNDLADVYETLVKSTYSKNDLNLIAPKNGKHQLVINTFTDELNRKFAIVFYENRENDQATEIEDSIRMAILQKQENNRWILKVNMPCPGTDIEEIILTKNKNNPNYFLIVGVKVQPKNINKLLTNNKFFTVYNFDINNFSALNFKKQNVYAYYPPYKRHTEIYNYKAMKICNLNENENRLVVVTYENVNNPFIDKPYLTYFDLHQNFIEIEKTLKTKLNYADNYDINIDYKSLNKPVLFINEKLDTSINDEQTQTEVFEYNYDTFKPIFKTKYMSNCPTCCDIYCDGKIEVPEVQNFASYSSNNSKIAKIDNPPLITNWHKLINSNEQIKSEIVRTYTNIKHGFGFILPDSWNNKTIYATYLNKQKTIEFYEHDENKTNLKNKKLLTITSNYSNQPPSSDFFMLKSNGPFFFWAKLYNHNSINNKNLLITKQQLTNSFFLMKGQL